jgi:hypothetical protein
MFAWRLEGSTWEKSWKEANYVLGSSEDKFLVYGSRLHKFEGKKLVGVDSVA